MNVRDSEVICGLLKQAGFSLTDDPAQAGVILLNTCSVRQNAEQRVWSEIGRYKEGKIVGIVGCMAQEHKEKIFERAQNINFAVGTADIEKIPAIIASLIKDKEGILERKIWETGGAARTDQIYHTGFYQDKRHAFVVISEGCSNFCSYCVVPYVRGALRNRGYKDILKEIKEAIEKGITEITLLGQNVNAYRFEGTDFIKLIELVSRVKGLKSLDFVTSHPKDTTVDLFKAMADTKNLKKWLHLPIQSGSDRILNLMNRGYTRKYYLDLANNYRKIVKGALLTTDAILGFPTETEVDFQETYDLFKKVEFDAAYIFKYSPRPNAKSAKMPDDVRRQEKERRHNLILELQKRISRIKLNKRKNLN